MIKFSYPGEGHTPSTRAPSLADLVLVVILILSFNQQKNNIFMYFYLINNPKILLKRALKMHLRSKNSNFPNQGTSTPLPLEPHPPQTLLSSQSPYLFIYKKLTLLQGNIYCKILVKGGGMTTGEKMKN